MARLAEFHMTDADRYELKIAGLLHDCGKIATRCMWWKKPQTANPVRPHRPDRHLVSKSKRDLQIAAVRQGQLTEAQYHSQLEQLDTDRQCVRRPTRAASSCQPKTSPASNRSPPANGAAPDGQLQPLLSTGGNSQPQHLARHLNADERAIINQHINDTIRNAGEPSTPRYLQHVPEYAGGHHERMDGKATATSPRRPDVHPARIMAIADVFEALTASDRPYKPPMKLSWVLSIMGNMAATGHVDPDLYDVFVQKKVYMQYAQQFWDGNSWTYSR